VPPSIGDLVLTWISYLDQGIFAAGADGAWEGHVDYPEEVWRPGVY